MPTREEVYNVIDGERNYQDSKWNGGTTPTKGEHHTSAWLTFIRSYLREAEDVISHAADPLANEMALHIVRKIAAMSVACLEQNGAPPREL